MIVVNCFHLAAALPCAEGGRSAPEVGNIHSFQMECYLLKLTDVWIQDHTGYIMSGGNLVDCVKKYLIGYIYLYMCMYKYLSIYLSI